MASPNLSRRLAQQSASQSLEIDSSGPEIFETPDVENIDAQILEQPSGDSGAVGHSSIFLEGDDLVSSRVEPVQAFEVFAGKRFETRAADFSESVGKATRTVAVYNSDVAGPVDLNEPITDAIQRLVFEVNHLQTRCERESQSQPQSQPNISSSSVSDLKSELNTLKDRLSLLAADSIKWSPELSSLPSSQSELTQRLQSIISSSSSSSSAAADQPPMDGPSSSSANVTTLELYLRNSDENGSERIRKALDLEQRLSSLEKVLGAQSVLAGRAPALEGHGLAAAVNRLEQRVSLLLSAISGPGAASSSPASSSPSVSSSSPSVGSSSSALDRLQARISITIPEMDACIKRAQELSHLGNSNDAAAQIASRLDAAKVQEVVQTVERWDSVARQVPAVLGRLHSLRRVHEDAAEVTKSVDEITAQQAALSNSLVSASDLLKHVEEGLSKNLTVMQENMTSLDERMNALFARVQALK